MDIDPNSVIELAKAVAEVRATANQQAREKPVSESYTWLLERATELALEFDLPAECFEKVGDDGRA